MATTTVIYDNITFFLLQPVSSTSSPLRPEGADSPTVLSSQRMRMRGESADGQVGSRAQPPVEAARARTPPGPQGHSRAPIPGRRSRQLAPQRQPRRRAPPTRPPKGTHARDRPHGQEGRRPSGRRRPEPHRGGREHRPSATRRPGRFDHAFRRLRGRSATRPTHQGYAGDPPRHPAEVVPGDVMRKYRPRAARNKRPAAWHSR